MAHHRRGRRARVQAGGRTRRRLRPLPVRDRPGRRRDHRGGVGYAPPVIYLVYALWFGVAAGVVGRVKGSSFFIWFLVGLVLPVLGLLIAVLYRSERDEVRRQCPTCGKVVKLHDAMCMRCGTDLDFPEYAIEPESAALRR